MNSLPSRHSAFARALHNPNGAPGRPFTDALGPIVYNRPSPMQLLRNLRPFGAAQPPGAQGIRPYTRVYNAMQSIPRRIRSHFPVHAASNASGATSLMSGGTPGRMTSIGRFLNTHKRKLIIGGAVAGGVAVIAGAISGALYAKRKKK